MTRPRYPALLQVNTRLALAERAAAIGRPAALDDIPEQELDRWATDFDWVWLLGVWQTGPAGQRVSASRPEWIEEYRHVLSDFTPSDICGSCFAVQDYHVHAEFGGDEALLRIRHRLRNRGVRLLLDFVPNHTAPDHPWVDAHPEYYVGGSAEQLAAEPHNYVRVRTATGERILAHGRDPNFPGWPDSLQLDYGSRRLQDAMIGELRRVAALCDGVRCDMAMLVLPDVFARTWGITPEPFWPRAIEAVHHEAPDFLFVAEAYWDLEWTLQQLGFDYTYDKRLYDRLRDRNARAVRAHLVAGLDFQERLVRFLENHDEPRAASVFPPAIHKPAALLTYLSPGLRFFHQGQFEGRKVRVPVHLRRGPEERSDPATAALYEVLLDQLREPIYRDGDWRLLECRSAWDGNWTSDSFVAYGWTHTDESKRLVIVNYADHPSQCYVMLPWPDLEDGTWRLTDRFSEAVYDRNGDDLAARGLYVDMPAWGCHVFEVMLVDRKAAEAEAEDRLRQPA